MNNASPKRPDSVLLGVDTGGTFTDFVVWRDGRLTTTKVLSTPDDPARAIIQGLDKLGIADNLRELVHGTTVGTNAVLEGQGARVVLITNDGFTDMLSLARQNREALYSLDQPPVEPPIPPEDCIGVSGRLGADGQELESTGPEELERLHKEVARRDPEAVAVNLLYSFSNSAPESAIAESLGDRWPVSVSSRVLPEIREYERGIATWLNASVGPKLSGYLNRLDKGLADSAGLSIMQSDGTTVAAEQAVTRAVHLLLSGPAGGLAAAAHIGREADEDRLLTFDMGGTSTDVALVEDRPVLTRRGRIGRYPVAVPMVDMETIGAGGGSLARADEGGALRVGPESAGADPGPACYGQGGTGVTVTDAHFFLGHIPESVRLGNDMVLDRDASTRAVGQLAETLGLSREEAARGVLRIANENMSRALRVMSAERGLDPAELCLMSFGGAGGLHVCELAESLGMNRALVPARSGVLSALGMLVAEPGRNLTVSLLTPADECSPGWLDEQFQSLEHEAVGALEDEGLERDEITLQRRVECRYQGQDATLMVDAGAPGAMAEDFHKIHQEAFGYRLDLPVELVTANLQARGRPRLREVPGPEADRDLSEGHSTVAGLDEPVPVIPRGRLETGQARPGPLIVLDAEATTWVAPGWRVQPDSHGHLRLDRDPD